MKARLFKLARFFSFPIQIQRLYQIPVLPPAANVASFLSSRLIMANGWVGDLKDLLHLKGNFARALINDGLA